MRSPVFCVCCFLSVIESGDLWAQTRFNVRRSDACVCPECVLRDPFNIFTGNAPESLEHSGATLHVHEAVARAASAMFVDAHNTGYYINAYTTKSNPGMDNVMQKLLAGLRRLKDQ